MPRAGLSTSRVVAEAAGLVDEIGWEELTLAAVADRVGVRLPSLYRHVAGVTDLRRLLAVAARQEAGVVLRSAVEGRTGQDALRSAGHALRSWGLRHPGRFAATRRAPDLAEPEEVTASAEATQALFAVLDEYGFEGDRLVDATRMVRASIDGFVTIESSGGFGIDRDVETSFDWMLEALDRALRDPGPGGRA